MNDAETYRLIALEKALKLEQLGMKRRGQSAYSLAKQHYGLKGNATLGRKFARALD